MRLAMLMENERLIVAAVAALALLSLLIPIVLREACCDGLPYGTAAYAELIGIAAVQRGEAPFSPYHSLLASATGLAPAETTALAFGLVAGLLSVVLFLHILRAFGSLPGFMLLSGVLLVMTPAFITTFSSPNSAALHVPLVLLAFSLFLQRRLWLRLLVLPVLGALLLAGLFPFFLAVVLLVARYLTKKKQSVVLLGLLFLYIASSFVSVLLKNGLSFVPRYAIADFGGFAALGVFSVLLLLAGILIMWKSRFGMNEVFAALLYLAGSAFLFGREVLPFVAFAAAIFGAVSFSFFVRSHWEVSIIKNLTILLVVCGLIFSTLSYYHRIADAEPSPETSAAMQRLRGFPQGNVLSAPSRGLWIAYFAGMPAVADSRDEGTARWQNVTVLLATRSLDTARTMMQERNVQYIWIDQKMRQGEVWSRDEEGLLFLLRNNETFKNLFSENGTELWRVFPANRSG